MKIALSSATYRALLLNCGQLAKQWGVFLKECCRSTAHIHYFPSLLMHSLLLCWMPDRHKADTATTRRRTDARKKLKRRQLIWILELCLLDSYCRVYNKLKIKQIYIKYSQLQTK